MKSLIKLVREWRELKDKPQYDYQAPKNKDLRKRKRLLRTQYLLLKREECYTN